MLVVFYEYVRLVQIESGFSHQVSLVEMACRRSGSKSEGINNWAIVVRDRLQEFSFWIVIKALVVPDVAVGSLEKLGYSQVLRHDL